MSNHRAAPAATQLGAGRGRPTRFRFGPWLVDPASNSIEQAGETRQMEPRTMDVLVALCRAGGAIISAEELLECCWGTRLHGDNPVHKNLAQLRRLLGDSATAPTFIETIRKRGYRTVATVEFDIDADKPAEWKGGSPFRGLLPFNESCADVFYGREQATRQLVAAALAQVDSGLALLLLLGPSGSGKTSLVQAGLLPALSGARGASRATVRAATMFDIADLGEQTLFSALASALLDLQWNDAWAFENENAVALGERLEHDCPAVLETLRGALAVHPGMRFAVFVDRFEALFNGQRITEPERAAFLSVLEQLARSGACLIVLACRNDFYPSIARYRVLIECKAYGGHVDLAPPSFSEIAQMIRKPAAAVGLTFGLDPVTGASLDDVLCASASSSPDTLPLLQYCLHELYRLRTADNELSFDVFRELGGFDGAIGGRAEQVVMKLDDAQRAALPHINSLVTVVSPDDEQVTSQRAPWSALHGDAARQTVTALIEARLFVTDLAGGTPVFGIAHEAILRCWPRMSDWIAAHRDALRTRGRLARQAARWDADGRPPDLLLPRGKPLDEARTLQRTGLWSLALAEQDLIRQSVRHARRFERLRLAALGVIIVLVFLGLALAFNAYRAKRSADARRAEVEGLVDFMLGDFADKLRPLGRLDLLESVSGKALEYLRGSKDDELSRTGLTLRAKALQVIGEVGRSRGNAAQAVDALQKANQILTRQHDADPRDVQVLNNLGNNAYWIGQLHKDHNDMASAEEAWLQYLRFSDQLHALEPDKVDWWVEQSYAHNNLGSLALARGLPAPAATEFSASIALKERALGRMPGSKMLLAELADSYSWLASARQAQGDLREAMRLHGKAIDLDKRLRHLFPDEPMWDNRLVRALEQRATLSTALGMEDGALADLQTAQALFSRVAQQYKENHEWQVELANLDLDLLRLKARRPHGGALLAEIERVHAVLLAALRRDPRNAQWAVSEAVARGRMASALLAAGDAAAARREIDVAVTRLRQLSAANPASLTTRLALTRALLVAAQIFEGTRDTAAARTACQQARAAIAPDPASMNFEILDPWVRAALCMKNTDDADTPRKRLQQIGYRDSVYRQAISHY